MPVQKFRTLDDARQALWTTSDDPRLIRRITALVRMSNRLSLVHPPTGVRRFHGIEEAQAERKTWPVETFFKAAETPEE